MNIRRHFFSIAIFSLTLGLFFIPNLALADCESDAKAEWSTCEKTSSDTLNDCYSGCGSSSICTGLCDDDYESDVDWCDDEQEDALKICTAEDKAETKARAEEAESVMTIPTTQTENPKTALSTSYDDIMKQGIIFAGICTSRNTDCECRDTGDCTLDDILQVAVNISVLILGLIGSIVLLMFMYGGFLWLTSQGKPDAIKKGKDTLVNAVIGLIIVFGAYTAITVVIKVITTGNVPEAGETIENTINTDLIKTITE